MSESFAARVWETLSTINVNDHVQKKMNLSYLSWAWAWGTLMENYPESKMEFKEPVSLPDGSCEIWVTVTIVDGDKSISREMWLPVMNHKMQSVQNPSSRDINDARMRALTKCLALHGLGHYIYAGEDLPGAPKKYDVYANDIIIAVNNDDRMGLDQLWKELDTEEKILVWDILKPDSSIRSKAKKMLKENE